MTELKTEESLLHALQQASGHTPNSEELRRQRVSFIMGSVTESSGVTRARVEEVLAAQEGRKPT